MEEEVMAVVAGLAGPGLSRDRVAHHTSVITAALGTEVPAAVPTSTLHSLARRSGQPGPFVQQFSSCSAQQIPQLSGMVALLDRLGQEEGLRAALAESSESVSGNQYSSQPVNALSPDFKTLRERLLKEVVSSSAAAAQLERPRPPPPFAHRPNLTANFLPEGVQQPSSRRRTTLAGVPASSQESLLLEELLYTLVGNQGEHITPCRAGNPASVSFTLDPDMDPSLAALVQRLLPLAQHYSAVVAWCEAVRPQDGLVNQALAAGVEQLVLDYTKLVCQLEQRLARAELTLHSLHHALQSSKQCMELLAGLVHDVTARQATGGATLSILHSKQLHCASHPKSEKVIQFLTELAAKPFFETLSAWLHRGVIVDPGRDFFVEDHEVVDRACLPTEYNDDYWEKRYGLRLDQLPTFLARYADTVLRTGKYLNVIQQCDKTAKWRPIVPLQYLQNPEHYSEIFTEAHQFASTNLLQLLINDRDLIGHLKSVKKYFLMEQGDFICQFLDLCESELSQSVDCVEPARLESLLEMAARTSTANYDAYKDNLCVALLPYDLEFQMGKIMAIDTADEGEYQQCDTSLLSGMDAFAFGYQVEWPISLVLNHKALAQYQMLFRHFFYCKHIERLLSAVWISNKQTRFLPSKEFKVYHPAFGLRQKMLNLIQNLSYYMCVEVVEPAWNSLVTSIANCITIDDVLTKHGDFLNCCLHDCLLSSPQLLATVKKLLCVCADFAQYMQNLQVSDAMEFTEDVKRYELQFSSVLASLLDRISQLGRDNYNEKVLNILHRLDFNGFYTVAMEQFQSTIGNNLPRESD